VQRPPDSAPGLAGGSSPALEPGEPAFEPEDISLAVPGHVAQRSELPVGLTKPTDEPLQ
jgi:hypothetical protein